MRYPKILITTYSTAFLSAGGGEFEIIDLVLLLRSIGHEVDIYGIDSKKLNSYSCAFHYSVHPYGYDIFNELIKNDMPVFLWPNIWLQSEPNSAQKELILNFIRPALTLLFKSNVELDNFAHYFPDFYHKCKVLPITLPKEYLQYKSQQDARLICNYEKYILSIGRIEPIKNQLELIKACNLTDQNCVFVGGFTDDAYFNQCKAIAGVNIQFLPPIKPQSDLLLSLISLSTACAEISLDPPGRSAVEYAILKKPVLQAHQNWADEVFSGFTYMTNPKDQDLICEQLLCAISDKNNLINSAYSVIEDHHTITGKCNKFISTLKELIGNV